MIQKENSCPPLPLKVYTTVILICFVATRAVRIVFSHFRFYCPDVCVNGRGKSTDRIGPLIIGLLSLSPCINHWKYAQTCKLCL